jgi:predicted nucleotidyltransferase
MTMLDVARVDLADLAQALQDHSYEHSWWFDPRTGAVELWSDDIADELDEEHPDERGLIAIEPEHSSEAWQDMADFAAMVPDPEVRRRLERAIEGRGAFRRFKDELLDHPELREAWFALADARIERRALRWLADEGLVDEAQAERHVAERPDPPPPAPKGDRFALARAVTEDLRGLYGDRLERVLVFGSSARGDADEESDLDLLVVLDDMDSSWAEGGRMDELLWRHSLESGIVVSALPVRARDLKPPSRPCLVRALAEGIEV